MSQGFLALNNNNQVLISQDTRNLHFVGKASFYSIYNSFSDYGGLAQMKFRITCNVVPVPFFTMPTANFYGVTAIRQIDSTTWEIEIIRSGGPTIVTTTTTSQVRDPETGYYGDLSQYYFRYDSWDSNYIFETVIVYAGVQVGVFDGYVTQATINGWTYYAVNESTSWNYGVDGMPNYKFANLYRSGTQTTTTNVPTVPNPPEVYVFADPRGLGSARNSNLGLLVYASDGTPAFDSRLFPLAVTGGLSVTHPSNPKPVLPYGLDPRFCGSPSGTSGPVFQPDQYNSYSLTDAPSKPMFFFPSLAQSEREASYSATEKKCDGASVKGNCIGAQRTHRYVSTYWAFYRGGIRYTGVALDAGWIVVQWGCNWTETSDSSLIGIGTGGSSGSGGTWPYSNDTINLSAASVIIGDASKYD